MSSSDRYKQKCLVCKEQFSSKWRGATRISHHLKSVSQHSTIKCKIGWLCPECSVKYIDGEVLNLIVVNGLPNKRGIYRKTEQVTV